MNGVKKRIFFVNVLPHQAYAHALAERADVALDRLEPDGPDNIGAPIIGAAHAYQVNSSRAEVPPHLVPGAALLRSAPNLLIVSTNGVGYDGVDVAACSEAGVLVVNQAGGNREAVAEHVLGMMLCLSKRIVESDRLMRREKVNRTSLMGHDIAGKTIGIIGLGHVGKRVAELCRGPFGMHVIATDPYVSAEEMRPLGVERAELDDLLHRADFVSINCPLSQETRGLMGAREFARMRPGSYFITTARGHIHDEAALVIALRSGAIAGAGLDVWADEPPPLDHPLLAFDNVVLSPHTAGVTHEARANIARMAAQNLLDAFDGRRPARIVNPDAWPAYQLRFKCAFGALPQ
jgi:D-3-phosphoglycerate dehydrogenase